MSIKSWAASLYAKYTVKKINDWANHPLKAQERTLQMLLKKAKNTAFGKDHSFATISNYEEFKQQVPVSDYEKLKNYVERVINGEKNVLWPGLPIYFAKTSGTTSGVKYIPISKESMPHHIQSAKEALLCYIDQSKNSQLVDGKMIFLQGSPKMEEKKGIQIGRLSGISAHYVPLYLQKNRKPSWETNCIDNWEDKITAITQETIQEDMSLISGIPPWLQMYFERLIESSGKESIIRIFPNLQLLITGGVNYTPYKDKMKQLLGKDLDVIQTYPASEGFIAYQNDLKDDSLLLLLNNGIFYEFIPVDEFYRKKPNRISLKEVQLNLDYVLILNTNAGLWAYNIGDTIRFTSLKPYKIKVSGRIKHFTSAFGEHVIAYEVEAALKQALDLISAQIKEFTVAPQVNPTEGLPFHEWFIEFDEKPSNLTDFAGELNQQMRTLNSYYDDLIKGNILDGLRITPVAKGGFNQYMKHIGKLGGQNKIPRLSNDRKIAQILFDHLEK